MEGQSNLGFDTGQDGSTSTAGPPRKGSFLEIDTNDINSHTYVYEPNLSLRRMTIEALPSEEGYRQNIMDLQDYRYFHKETMHSGMFCKVLFRCENIGRQEDFANF